MRARQATSGHGLTLAFHGSVPLDTCISDASPQRPGEVLAGDACHLFTSAVSLCGACVTVASSLSGD